MIDSITFLHGLRRPTCVATVDKHFTYDTLQMMTRGCVELFYDDRRIEMKGVWVWPCHPGPWIRFHEWPAGKSWDHRYIAFTGSRVAEWEVEGLWPIVAQPIASADQAKRLASWFDELLACKAQPNRWAQRTAVNLLERILLDLAQHRRASEHADRPDWLGRVMEELAVFTGEEPDYPALAESHGMALSTLRRQFREMVGASMHDYRLECRITAAKQSLGDTTLPIKQIAEQLGYRDVFYFSRQFRQRAGASPAAYRKSRQM